MIHNYLKKFALALFAFVAITSKAQTVLYNEDFGGPGNTFFPVSWTVGSTTADWYIDDNTNYTGIVPPCTVPGTSDNSVLAGGDGSIGLETAVSASFVTTGYSSITVSWNGYRSTGAPVLTFEYSLDDVTYFPVPGFSDVPTIDAWKPLTAITLPIGAEGKPVVYLRWSYTGTGAGNFIAFDDVIVTGSTAGTFYWNGVGALSTLSSWGDQLNGTGVNPTSFTAANQTFYMTNAASAALTAAWTVGGSSTKLYIGDGATAINFTIPTTFTMSLTGGAIMNVLNSATITLQNATFPPVGSVLLSAGSTVDYAQSVNSTIWKTTHYNLTISGSSYKSQSGSLTISGDLNLNGQDFNMVNSAGFTLFLNGTISGTGALKTYTLANLSIGGGPGAFGTVKFTNGTGAGATTRQLRNFTLTRTAGDAILGSDFTVSNSATFVNGNFNLNGKLLTLNGGVTLHAFAANGGFVGSRTSSLSIGTSTAGISNTLFFDQTSASTRAMADVTLNRSGQTLTLGNPLEVWGSITPIDGTIGSNGNLTIKSDAASKGRVGIITGSGAITGNATVEVYKAAGATGWTNLCSGGVKSTAFSNWNASFAITCPAGCPDGSTVGGVAFTSVYTYLESGFVGDYANAAHYVALGGTGTAIDANAGYWVYLGNGFPNTTAITSPLTGGLQYGSLGPISLSLTGGAGPQNGWNLIANPYPSPIDVSSIITANTDNTIYVYDPDTDSSVPFAAGGIVPMGQGFSIRALSNTSISPKEFWKTATASNQGILKTIAGTNAVSPYYFDDFLLDLTSTAVAKKFFTQAYFMFDNTTSATGFDNGKDAYFFDGSQDPGIPKMVSITNNEKFIRNAQPLSGTVNIPVAVYTGTAGVFTISPVNMNKLPAGACVKLFDIVHNVTHDLKTGPYTTTITANATTPQFELRVTLNNATMTSNVTNPFCNNTATGKIIASGTGAGPWNYTWKDASNNIIKTKNNSPSADTLKNIPTGTYKVDVNTVGSCDNASGSFNLVSTAPLPTSSFSVNKDTLLINGVNQFLFTNASVNAASYKWTFGDGASVNTPTASYMYANPGLYKVTLTAISACNDSSQFSHNVVALNSPTLAGVASIAANDNNIKIGKDANGVYVQLNYDKNVKANVSVSNILGQVLVSPRTIEGSTERFYFDITAKEQLLLITVSTSEKTTTQRIFN